MKTTRTNTIVRVTLSPAMHRSYQATAAKEGISIEAKLAAVLLIDPTHTVVVTVDPTMAYRPAHVEKETSA